MRGQRQKPAGDGVHGDHVTCPAAGGTPAMGAGAAAGTPVLHLL